MATDEPTTETFKQRDGASYDAVAELFDRFTERYTRDIARRMVDLARLGQGDRVLDVGTGTAVLALEAARRLGPAGRVVGIDLSEGMLATAKARAAAEGLSERVGFQREDAEALTLEAEAFDRVLSLFALFHFPHPARALSEMHRVTRPGGTLVLAVGSSPPFRSVQGVAYLARRLPFLVQQRRGRWLAAPGFLDALVEQHLGPLADQPLEADIARHRHAGVSAAALPVMLEAAGFVEVRTEARAGLGVLESPEEFWDLQRTFSSKSRKRLEAATAAQVAALRAAFLERCRDVQRRGGKLTYPYAAYILTAHRRF